MKNNNKNIPISSIFSRVSDGYNFISIFFFNFKPSLNQLTSALLCTLIRNQSPVDIFIGTVNLVGRLSPKLNVNLTWLFIISKAKNSVESISSAGLYSRSALEFIVTSVMSNVLSFVDDDKELNFIYEPTLNPTELYWHLSPQYVNGHSHLKLPTRFLHIPLTQGFGEQRLEPFSHNFPVKPSLQ
jgi:hypothetical protein